MNKNQKFFFAAILIIAAISSLSALSQIVWPTFNFSSLVIFHPKGPIALQERNLITTAVLLMLIAVVPVYFLLFFFATKYKEDKKEAAYSPRMQSSRSATIFLWAIPIIIISIISIINWQSTHKLDPYKPIASTNKPITIQVVALQWKWLFIYPEQNIATVNFIEFPENTPINFQLTADAPMSSFWIPELGGQMYAMPGMSTQLHLLADKTGEYKGSAAEINGSGFAGMIFTAKSTSKEEFETWASTVKQSSPNLNTSEYNKLTQISTNNPPAYFFLIEPGLYDSVINKYMLPPKK